MNSVVKNVLCALLLLPFVCSADHTYKIIFGTVSLSMLTIGFGSFVLALVRMISLLSTPQKEKSENTEDAPSPVIKSRKLLWPILRNLLLLLIYLLLLLISIVIMVIPAAWVSPGKPLPCLKNATEHDWVSDSGRPTKRRPTKKCKRCRLIYYPESWPSAEEREEARKARKRSMREW